MYESEHTRFMRELFQKKPALADEQKKGRAIWWDRELDPDQEKRDAQSRVNQTPYVYQTKV
ncbi:MAG TPA: DUF3460 family protein [Burkholderiales bacterium]|jgi:hypothetical protein|nr:DUF3460 family protein [Burkholderiales bacterium]